MSGATAYRYRDEGVEGIAARAPDLATVLTDARAEGLAYLCLDGTSVPTNRVAGHTERGDDTLVLGRAPPLQRQHPGHR